MDNSLISLFGQFLNVAKRISPGLACGLFDVLINHAARYGNEKQTQIASSVFTMVWGVDISGLPLNQAQAAFSVLAYSHAKTTDEYRDIVDKLFHTNNGSSDVIGVAFAALRSLPVSSMDEFIEALRPSVWQHIAESPDTTLPRMVSAILGNPHLCSGHDLFEIIEHIRTLSGLSTQDCAHAVRLVLVMTNRERQNTSVTMRDMLRLCNLYLGLALENGDILSQGESILSEEIPVFLKTYITLRLCTLSPQHAPALLPQFYKLLEDSMVKAMQADSTKDGVKKRKQIDYSVELIYYYLQAHPTALFNAPACTDERIQLYLDFARHHASKDRQTQALIAGLLLTPGGPFDPNWAVDWLCRRRSRPDYTSLSTIVLAGHSLADIISNPARTCPTLPCEPVIAGAIADFRSLHPEYQGVALNTLASYSAYAQKHGGMIENALSNATIASNPSALKANIWSSGGSPSTENDPGATTVAHQINAVAPQATSTVAQLYSKEIANFISRLITSVQTRRGLGALSYLVAVPHAEVGAMIEQHDAKLRNFNKGTMKAAEQNEGLLKAMGRGIRSGYSGVVVDYLFNHKLMPKMPPLLKLTMVGLSKLLLLTLTSPFIIVEKTSRLSHRRYTPGDALAHDLDRGKSSERQVLSYFQRREPSSIYIPPKKRWGDKSYLPLLLNVAGDNNAGVPDADPDATKQQNTSQAPTHSSYGIGL